MERRQFLESYVYKQEIGYVHIHFEEEEKTTTQPQTMIGEEDKEISSASQVKPLTEAEHRKRALEAKAYHYVIGMIDKEDYHKQLS